MPNHTDNYIHIMAKSEIIEEIKSKLFTYKYKKIAGKVYNHIPSFDFNNLIPMPHILRGSLIVAGSLSDFDDRNYMEISTHEDCDIFSGIRQKSREHITTDEYNLTTFDLVKGKGTDEEILEHGKKYCFPVPEPLRHAIKDIYGHSTWYNWAVANWGTKWNAYDQNIIFINEPEIINGIEYLDIHMYFHTAWSPPEPVYMKLIEMFPDIILTGHAVDEGGGYYVHYNYSKDNGWIETDFNESEINEYHEGENEEHIEVF